MLALRPGSGERGAKTLRGVCRLARRPSWSFDSGRSSALRKWPGTLNLFRITIMSLSIHKKKQAFGEQDEHSDTLLLLLDPEMLSPLEMSLAGVCGRSLTSDGILLDLIQPARGSSRDEALLPSAAKKKTARRDDDEEEDEAADDSDDEESAEEEKGDDGEDVDEFGDDEEEDEDDEEDDDDEDEEDSEFDTDADSFDDDDDDDEDDFEDDE